MKKIIAALLCGVLLFGECGCGKKDDAAPEAAQTTQTDKSKQENPTGQTVVKDQKELDDMISEFNTTEDPVRKEELRKKLELLIEQVEGANNGENTGGENK